MRGILIFIGFLFFSKASYTQDSTDLISINFENISLSSALTELQNTSGIQFYYNPAWFGDSTISKRYKDRDIEYILKDLLTNTTVNFFVLDRNRVILTDNNVIYKDLPEGFFQSESSESLGNALEKTAAPVFYNATANRSGQATKTFRIGKESSTSQKALYRLTGTIINNDSGEPIPDMSILNSENKLIGVTGFDGSYNLMLPAGSNLLTFRALGFDRTEREIIIFNDGILNLSFYESIQQLDEIVLEGDIYKNIEEVSGGSERVDSEESKTVPLVLGERDVMKVATALPGISTAGEGATGFNVRGGRADQNLILLDGATIYNPQHFFGIFSAVNPFSIDKLEIYKGNIPAKFGGRLSSVFEMGTRDRDHEAIKGEASIGPVTSNVVLDIPVIKEKSSLMVGGRGAYANWILRSLNDEDLQNSSASFYDGIVNYSHEFNSKNKLNATGYYSYDNFSISSDSLYIYDNRLVSLQWQHKFNDKHVGELQFTNSKYGFNIEYERGANNDFNLGYAINESTVKANFNYVKNGRLSFNYGAETKFYTTQPGNIAPLNSQSSVAPITLEEERALESAGYLAANYELTKNLAVDLGMRYSVFTALGQRTQYQYSENSPKNPGTITDTLQYGTNDPIKTYGGPELRMGARYLISPSFSVKAGYNNTIQYIHILTNNTTVSPIDTWKLSDLNIEPQRGQQFSLGFFKNIDANSYEISVEGFYKKSRNVLDFKTGADLLLNETVETEILQGDGRSYGIEFLIRKNKGRLNGWLGYTYSRSFLRLDSEFDEEKVNNGAFFPSNFDKPHDLSMVTNYKFTRRFSLSANFVYQTGRPVTIPVGNIGFNGAEYAVYSDRNRFRIPDFYRLDLAFNIEGNHKLNKAGHSFWSISIYNALGRNNPYSVFYVTESGDVQAYKSSIFAIPVPAITYNLKF